MKKTLKLTFAALAAISLASCSTDDFFGNGDKSLKQQKGILVEVEDMLDPMTTRAAYVPNSDNLMATLYWQQNDQILVYDATVQKNDPYKFDSETQSFNISLPNGRTNPSITEPLYALYSGTATASMSWEASTGNSYINYTLPATWRWAEDEKSAGEGVLAYQSALPLWGEAEADEVYGVKAKMHYLTGILRIDLVNVPGNAKSIEVVGKIYDGANLVDAPMTGQFIATLAEDEVAVNPEEVTLVAKEDVNYTNKNKITVNIEGAKKENTVVFIPLIAQKYAELTIKVLNGSDEVASKVITDLNVERQKFYRWAAPALLVSGSDVTSINQALASKADAEGEVNIETSKVTNVTAEDYNLIIPEMNTDKITLNLQGLSGTQALHITSSADYAGELIINYVGTDAYNNNIFINLPNARVTFVGAGLNQTKLGGNTAGQNMIVKQLTIAASDDEDNPTKVNYIHVNAESCADGILIAEGATATAINLKDPVSGCAVGEIAIEGTLETDLNAAKDAYKDYVINVTVGKEASTKGIKTNQAEMTLNGNATVAGTLEGKLKKVTMTDEASVDYVLLTEEGSEVNLNKKATARLLQGHVVYLTGDANSEGQVTAIESLTVGGNAYVTNATVLGDVKIARKSEGIAVKGILEMTGANYADDEDAHPTLELTGGYINSLKTGAPIVIKNKENYQTAFIPDTQFEVVTDEETGFTYESEWCGKPITVENEDGTPSDFVSYVQALDIYTASQLASLNYPTGNVTLNADVNLAGGELTPLAIGNKGFDGNGHTIKGLAISAPTKDNIGLFGTTTRSNYNHTIKNLTIEGANVSGKNNVGVLIGKAGHKTYVQNVTIKNSKVTAAENSAGGVVGAAEETGESLDEVLFSGVTLSGDSVQGKHFLGGLIGKGINVQVANSDGKMGVSFTVTGAQTGIENFDKDAGTVGAYVGKVEYTLSVDKPHTAKPADNILKGKRKELGFRANFKLETDNKLYVYYGSSTGDVGQCTNYLINTVAVPNNNVNKDKVSDIQSANAINSYVLSGASDISNY